MTEVLVYDVNGEVYNSLKINDEITHVNGRVSKGEKYYYKGVGVPYLGQFITEISEQYVDCQECDVFYMGYFVKNPSFIGKYGIFQEKYQPQFSDFIGSCGVKELSLIENSEEFELSSVKVLDVINYDKDNQQYYFKLDYQCGRRKYLEGGDPIKLRYLLDYMMVNDWNFIWDKTSITDITYDGRVSDVADIFHSNNLNNKLGTVYSVLYSLSKINHEEYLKFLKVNGMNHSSDMDYVINSMQIMRDAGVDVNPLFKPGTMFDIYKNIVLNHLIVGRNCGDCCYIELGDKIREQYKEKILKQFLNT